MAKRISTTRRPKTHKSELDKLAESIGSAIWRHIYKYVLPIVLLVMFIFFLYGVISNCIILNPKYSNYWSCFKDQISYGFSFWKNTNNLE